MTTQEIEIWVNRIVSACLNGHPTENDRVELKSTWIDPSKAARRIAAHSNSMSAQSILWIIGVDETAQKLAAPIKRSDFATWWMQVEACFDGLAPKLTVVDVPFNGQVLVALYMEADHLPYITKVSTGISDREIPWREGTRTRSARRHEVLEILVPQSRIRQIRIESGTMTYSQIPGNDRYIYDFQAHIYLIPDVHTERLVFPFSDCSGQIFYPPSGGSLSLTKHSLGYPQGIGAPRFLLDDFGQVIVSGPTILRLFGSREHNINHYSAGPFMHYVDFTLKAIEINTPFALRFYMNPNFFAQTGNDVAKWNVDPSKSFGYPK